MGLADRIRKRNKYRQSDYLIEQLDYAYQLLILVSDGHEIGPETQEPEWRKHFSKFQKNYHRIVGITL